VIHVDQKPAPNNFEERVLRRGQAFLQRFPNPTQSQWKTHSYWREVLGHLHKEYRGICAYTCHWIAYDTGAKTVEHFLPKSEHPNEAYHWENYRLVCQLLNTRKRTNESIMDPFFIKDGWFTIDFPSLLVKPASGLTEIQNERVKMTRDQLRLNDESTCLKTRARYVERYCKRSIDFQYLREEAPFLALELTRQDLVNTINDIMGYDLNQVTMEH
jgi:hypothetical protein